MTHRQKPMTQDTNDHTKSSVEKPVSLNPLRFKEALAGLLAVKPPPEEQPGKRAKKAALKPIKKKDSKPKRES